MPPWGALVAGGSDATLTDVSVRVTPSPSDTASNTRPTTDPSTSTEPVESSWTRQRPDGEPGTDQPMLVVRPTDSNRRSTVLWARMPNAAV